MTDSQTAEAGASFAPFLPSNTEATDPPNAPDPATPRSLVLENAMVAPDLDNAFSCTNHFDDEAGGDWLTPANEGQRKSHRGEVGLEAPSTAGRRNAHRGWTPERKRLFHQTLAESGVVLEAARAAGMSAHAAYALRNRDPLFDAGWEAALTLARRRLVDDLYARAVNGVVEQVYRGGVKVGERHRYDNRLSMAVLTRLDARLDRAEARGDAHLRVARRWDDYLDALGADRADEAQELLAAPEPEPEEIAETAQHCDLHDVEEVEMDEDDEETRALHFYNGMSAWQEHGVWWTDFPPPDDFDGEEDGEWGVDDDYRRELTPDEQAVYDAQAAADIAEARRLRDLYFELTVEEEKTQDADAGASGGDVPDPPAPQ